MRIKELMVLLMCVSMMGCAAKTVGYSVVGAAAGAGIGYSYHKDPKMAVIGGLGGGALGAAVGGIESYYDNKNNKAAYEKGYNQAQVDIAIQNWDENTGKCACIKKEQYKHLIQFRVPEKKQDQVTYESHNVTLEDYR